MADPPPAPPSSSWWSPSSWWPFSSAATPTTTAASAGGLRPPPEGQPQTVEEYIAQQARKYKVPPELAFAILNKESKGIHQTGGQLNLGAPTKTGERAQGFFQLLPSTAYGEFGLDASNPLKNIEAGVRYLRKGLDLNDNDPEGAAAFYHGGPDVRQHGPLTQAYARDIGDELRAAVAARGDRPGQQPQQPQQPGSQVGTAPPSPSAFAQEHPWINEFIQGLDPHEIRGRQNIAGMVGSTLGGWAGLPFGPWAAKAASAAGAGLAGGAEQLFVEETGLGQKLGEWLPFGEVDVKPVPGKPEDFQSRVLAAAQEQAMGDIFGQALMGGGRLLGKRALQSRVGKAAFDFYQQNLAKDVEELIGGLNGLKAAQRWLGREKQLAEQAGTQAVRDVRFQQAGLLREARAGKVGEVAAAEEQLTAAKQALDQARGGDRERLRVLRDAAEAQLQSAKVEAQRGVEQAEVRGAQGVVTAAEPYAAQFAQGPSEAAAGLAARGVYEGSAKEAFDALGKTIDRAAANGPDVNVRPLQEEVGRIISEEFLPRIREMPTRVPLPGGSAPSVEAAAMGLRDVSTAQFAELQKEPAMGIFSQILNAPDTIPFALAHQWKSDLGHALNVKGTFGRTVNPKVDSLAQHVVGRLRESLRLAGPNQAGHAPYEAATAAYEAAAPLFTEGFAETLARTARAAPEKLAQAISLDNPTATRHLVDVLTTYAEKGGGEAGRRAGQEALEKLQDAWIYRHIAQGGIETLGNRLAKLRASPNYPEFAQSFLSQELPQRVLGNLEKLSNAYEQAIEQSARDVVEARARGAVGTRLEEETGRRTVRGAEQLGAEQVRAATEAVGKAETARTGAQAAGAARVEAAREAKDVALREAQARAEAAVRPLEEKQFLGREQIAAAQEALRQRKLGTPEEQAFARSTLRPKARREVEAEVADGLRAGVLGIGNLWGGLSWARLMKGASDADMLLYAAHDKNWTNAVIQLLLRRSRQPWTSAIPAQFIKSEVIQREPRRRPQQQLTTEQVQQQMAAPPPPPPPPPEVQ